MAYALVMQQGVIVVGEVGDVKIDAPVFVVTPACESHSRLLASVFAQCNARRIANFFKRAVSFVDVQKLWRRVVDYYQVEKIIFVDVNECGRKPVKALRITHSRFDADIFEGAVSSLVVERIVLTLQTAWSAHHRYAAKLAKVFRDTGLAEVRGIEREVVNIKLKIAGNKNVQSTISIVVSEAWPGAPAFSRATKLFSDVCEGAIAVVMIETRHTIVADINVGPAIIVVIADSDPHSPTLVCDARFVGHVLKAPIAEVVKKCRTRWFFLSTNCIERRPV